jgi:CubicO group peptidase (beta-lactamase class C family)
MKTAVRSSVECLVLFALLAFPLTAGLLPYGKPEDVGVSSERLQRIHEAIQRHIDAGDISGAVTLVARRGRIVHFEAHGLMDIESKKPMAKDTIFRLASMTKPITAVAVLLLVEEGKVRFDDPVSKFIPEYEYMQVAVAKDLGRPPGPGQGAADQELSLVPAARRITVHDLLTQTSGLGSGGIGTRELPKVAPRGPSDTLARYVPKLALVPLDFQPWTLWRYSPTAGFETLSRVVEVVSGQPFDQFLKQHIFDPLGMKDTGFIVPEGRQGRLATFYRKDPKGLGRAPESPLVSETYFSGAWGLMSTAEDYAQLAEMLLQGGQLNGKRFLSPKTVELMASNHVGELFDDAKFNGYPGRGVGYGLGVSVMQDQVAAGMRVSNGSFGWNGAFGAKLWVDPKEKMVELLLMQTPNPTIHRDFENAVMQSLVE